MIDPEMVGAARIEHATPPVRTVGKRTFASIHGRENPIKAKTCVHKRPPVFFMLFSWILERRKKLPDLSRIKEREKVKPKAGDEPHWQRLRQGCYVGFRPSKKGKRGTWFARAYDPDGNNYRRKALGDYGGCQAMTYSREPRVMPKVGLKRLKSPASARATW